MPWEGPPPSVPSTQAVARAVSDTLDEYGNELLKALRRGSPRVTGKLRRSWRHRGKRTLTRAIKPTTSYAYKINIDHSAGLPLMAALDEAIAEDIDAGFR